MTPRTVAFTQLEGNTNAVAAGPSYHPSQYAPPTSSGQGPSRSLPFRQQYGDGVDGS
jgi:hypothetical protein